MSAVKVENPSGQTLTVWDWMAVMVALVVILSLIGATYRIDQAELVTDVGGLAQPIEWMAVSWLPPRNWGWISKWEWVRIVPGALLLGLMFGALARAPLWGRSEQKEAEKPNVMDPSYAVRHNGVDTPELDHLSAILRCTPGNHETLLRNLDEYQIPRVVPAMRMVPLNSRPTQQQQEQAEANRSVATLDR